MATVSGILRTEQLTICGSKHDGPLVHCDERLNPSHKQKRPVMTIHLNSSISDAASKLEADPEQSLVFERFLPATEVLEVCEKFGHCFRDRIYTPVITLWMFPGQTLSPDHSCRDEVHRFNTWRTSHRKKKADSNTTSYCEARQRLP